MGQKVNPTGFRLVTRKKWLSNWFAPKRLFGDWVGEDFKVRAFLQKKYQGASRFLIERERSGKFKVTIVTSRPGLVIGKKGAEIETVRKELAALIKRELREVFVEVEEIKFPVLDAKSVADGIARQLERRLPFRRVLKKAMQETMGHRQAGGIKVQVSGRIGGAEIARTEWYKEGRTPLHTLKANIDYAQARSQTTYGTIGVKVWIYLGDEVVVKPKQVVGS
jgi:small subunit ribosomal protein S3